jgi:hypothetical protein
VPAALGGNFKDEPVTLPPESWYPGLREYVRQDEISKRKEAIAKAEKAVSSNPDQLNLATLAASRSDLDALNARIAADNVVYLGAKGDRQQVMKAAAYAEARHQVDLALLKAANPNLTDSQRAEAHSNVRHELQALEEIRPKYTPISPIYPKTSTGRRTALANWITSRDNPLTARVAVNHIWNWHFGKPLVETTMNFGRSGKAPTHPELLDWLATEFMNNRWHEKPLHKLIVTSRAYRMKSTGDVKPDPDNVWLTRFPTNRMEAEVVRDSLLHLADELDPTIGGVEIPQEQAMTSKRRSIYLDHHGETRAQFLDLFDAANPCDAYRRTISVLPQQALALSNSDLSLQLSRTLAKKLPFGNDEEFVTAAFEQVLSRPPRPAERTASLAFLEQQRKLFEPELKGTDSAERARGNLVQALFNHTDFVTIR